MLQGSLLGVVGLVLAFGLSLAIGRYEARRASVVNEANTIGTTFLRAQTLAEPMRSSSLQLLDTYADTQILLTQSVSGSTPAVAAVATGSACSGSCGRWPGRHRSPTRTAPPPGCTWRG